MKRFEAARAHGFQRAECWSPFSEDLEEFAETVRDSGLELVGFNLDAGDMPAGERGFLNRPDRTEAVLDNARVAIELASQLGVSCINALVGNSTGEARDEQLDVVAEVLGEIASLAEDGRTTVLVEALNPAENPDYLLRNVDEASQLVESVGHPQVELLFDAYHAARADRDIEADFRKHRERIAHIQIADSPGRHEPGSGDIDFASFFETVGRDGYEGAVGLEYFPSGSTTESLAWLPDSERGGSVSFPSPEVTDS